MTPVKLEPTALRSRVKHSTTEPLRFLDCTTVIMCYGLLFSGFDVYDDCGIERYSINKAIDVVDGFPLGSDACAESTGTACQIGMFLNM